MTMSKKPLMDAQEIIYDAWEESNPRVRVALANKALAISPLCADAKNVGRKTGAVPQGS